MESKIVGTFVHSIFLGRSNRFNLLKNNIYKFTGECLPDDFADREWVACGVCFKQFMCCVWCEGAQEHNLFKWIINEKHRHECVLSYVCLIRRGILQMRVRCRWIVYNAHFRNLKGLYSIKKRGMHNLAGSAGLFPRKRNGMLE